MSSIAKLTARLHPVVIELGKWAALLIAIKLALLFVEPGLKISPYNMF